MSTAGDNNNDNASDICANCGKGEESTNSLKACTACHMVKYCNRECQIAHRSQHKKECKKRAKELHEEKLFEQPPPLGDCSICMLRLPLLHTGRTYQTCCGNMICTGCIHAPVYDHEGNVVDNQKCPFCRIPSPEAGEEVFERVNKRIELNDSIAVYNRGCDYASGDSGLPQDYAKALECWNQAAELGSAEAYFNIGSAYNGGHGVEVDKKKATHYYELAAIRGDTAARFNLGNNEYRLGNTDRAFKHYTIAVKDGDSASLENIKRMHMNGQATQDDYTKALRAYQTYLDEIKSDQRDKVALAGEKYKYIE